MGVRCFRLKVGLDGSRRDEGTCSLVERIMAAVATSNSVIERGCLSRKTVNGLGVTFNEAVADTSMDFGRRMLAKFGWTEGKGLGRQENGMVDHIRVKQKSGGGCNIL